MYDPDAPENTIGCQDDWEFYTQTGQYAPTNSQVIAQVKKDITVSNAEKLMQVFDLVNQASQIITSIHHGEDVTSIESQNVRLAIRALQVRLDTRSKTIV